jgi:CelD/BcsL family acetyltransferase involved in cellulose biosynthesis
MSDKLTSRVISPERLEPHELSAWDQICKSIPSFQSAFLSPHFSRAAASVQSGIRVCVLQRAGQPVGFLPFRYTSAWGRCLAAAEPVANPLNDYFGLIAEPDVHLDARELLKHAGLAYLGFTHLDESQLSFGLDGEQPEGGLRIKFTNGLDYWNQLRTKRNFFHETNRRQRKLESAYGPLRFCFKEKDHASHLLHLVEMKRRQYKASGASDPLAPPWARALLAVLAMAEYQTCSGILSTLYAGDTWVASHFGLRSSHILHDWFPVYNPELREFGPGRLLLKSMCECATNEGIQCIDRGAGESPAKRDLGNERHLFYRGAWFRRGTRAMAVRMLWSLRWRLAPSAKPARSALAL